MAVSEKSKTNATSLYQVGSLGDHRLGIPHLKGKTFSAVPVNRKPFSLLIRLHQDHSVRKNKTFILVGMNNFHSIIYFTTHKVFGYYFVDMLLSPISLHSVNMQQIFKILPLWFKLVSIPFCDKLTNRPLYSKIIKIF